MKPSTQGEISLKHEHTVVYSGKALNLKTFDMKCAEFEGQAPHALENKIKAKVTKKKKKQAPGEERIHGHDKVYPTQPETPRIPSKHPSVTMSQSLEMDQIRQDYRKSVVYNGSIKKSPASKVASSSSSYGDDSNNSILNFK